MNWTATIGAFVTLCVVTVGGVVLWFQPIAEADGAGAELLPAPVSVLIYGGLSVVLFVWASRRTGAPYLAAFLIGAAQGILVVDLTLRGDRGIPTMAAGLVLIAATWLCTAFVYSWATRADRAATS